MGNQCCNAAGANSEAIESQDTTDPKSSDKKEEEPQAEPAADGSAEPSPGKGGLALTFNCYKKVTKNFSEGDSETLDKDTKEKQILKAWYGDAAKEWKGKGKNVTSKVKSLVKQGKQVKADSKLLGDAAPNLKKVLLIEMNEPEKKTFNFSSKPLEITFADKKMPIVVTAVSKNGQGTAKGVEKGMELLEINGEDISGGSYADAFGKIKASLETIPKA